MIRSLPDPAADDVQQLEWTQSPAPVVDEDGGQFGLAIGIIDVEDGAVASGDIDISSATVELAKSTGGGAFSTTGITQPSLSKAQGVVALETDFAASEWAAGDSYRVTVSGITATTGDGNTVELPEQRWYGAVSEESDITGQINTLHNTRIPDVLSLANIQAEAEDALETDITTLSPAANSVADVLDTIRQNSTLTSDFAATDKNTDAEIRDGVWSDSTKAAGANLDAAVSSRSSHSATDVNGSLWKRQTPDEGQTALADDAETTIADFGVVDGADGIRIDGAYFDVALGGHTQIDLKLKVEINGTRTQIGDTINVTSGGVVELSDFNAGVPVASPHVRVTAAGDTASPGTNGTVDRTIEHLAAT